MRFWTSDLHFGHENIIKFSERPFDSVQHMNEMLIHNWNSVVGWNDTVFVLGDFALGSIADSLPLARRLMGMKFLVPGNHDRVFSANKQAQRDRFWPLYSEHFTILPENITVTLDDDSEVNVSHFPYHGDHFTDDRFPDKRPVDDGKHLIHGHVHELWHTMDRQFNVGVDVNNFTPVAEDIIIDWVRGL